MASRRLSRGYEAFPLPGKTYLEPGNFIEAGECLSGAGEARGVAAPVGTEDGQTVKIAIGIAVFADSARTPTSFRPWRISAHLEVQSTL